MSDTQSKYIWMDGELVEYDKATVHVLTPALHYGLAAFEGIRCYDTAQGPAVFRLREHLERLIDSVLILGVRDFSYTVEDLRQARNDPRQPVSAVLHTPAGIYV
jgi:branched-chain amino acid aminotransferase